MKKYEIMPYDEIRDNIDELKKELENIDSISSEDIKTLSKFMSILLFMICNEYPMTNLLILQKLTGLTFERPSDLYDYFSKTIEFKSIDLIQMALAHQSDHK